MRAANDREIVFYFQIALSLLIVGTSPHGEMKGASLSPNRSPFSRSTDKGCPYFFGSSSTYSSPLQSTPKNFIFVNFTSQQLDGEVHLSSVALFSKSLSQII